MQQFAGTPHSERRQCMPGSGTAVRLPGMFSRLAAALLYFAVQSLRLCCRPFRAPEVHRIAFLQNDRESFSVSRNLLDELDGAACT